MCFLKHSQQILPLKFEGMFIYNYTYFLKKYNINPLNTSNRKSILDPFRVQTVE